jgi:hypothetical protein
MNTLNHFKFRQDKIRLIKFAVNITLFILSVSVSAQNTWTSTLKTVTPDAFRFLKYGEIPINEYTGTTNISIPLYTIKAHNFELPLELTYHSGGIRVSEEASWVGLGWDIQIGSVVQIVNGIDDFGSVYDLLSLPDYVYSPIQYPRTAQYYSASIPTQFSSPYFSLINFLGNLMPQNNTLVPIDDYFYTLQRDCSPDVMKADFLGHSIRFIQVPHTSNYLVLNKKGYVVTKTSLPNNNFGWKIVVPDGTQYYFEEVILNTTSIFNSPSGYGPYSSIFPSTGPVNLSIGWTGLNYISRCWQLSKIITTNNDVITFSYTTPSQRTDYGYSCSWDICSMTQTFNYWPVPGEHLGPIGNGPTKADGEEIFINQSTISSSGNYLTSIDFPTGSIYFNLSGRNDYSGSKKLENIFIYSKPNSTFIKSVDFHYSYFQSITNDLGFACPKSSNELQLRLRLDAVNESGSPPYVFTYNSTPLPRKNSFAVDYWGFYNGQISNTSILPNVLRMRYSPNDNLNSVLSQNQNNNASFLKYSKACVIEQIKYPTGGLTTFGYELNTFNNSLIIPDSSYVPLTPITNTYTCGSGLRIASITNWIGSGRVGRTVFNYQAGKIMVPQNHFRQFGDRDVFVDQFSGQFTLDTYSNYVIESNNLYSPNEFGAGNYVGYNTVTTTQLDANSISNGYSIRYYSNNEDYIQRFIDEYKISLPSLMNELQNGLITKEEIYNGINVLIKKKENYYRYIQNTTPYYGTQFCSLGEYGDPYWDPGTLHYIFVNRFRSDLAAYFPIFQTETLLDSTHVTTIEGTQTLLERKINYYNSYNLVNMIKSNTSDNEYITSSCLYPDEALSSQEFTSNEQYSMYLLSMANRHSEKVLTTESCISGSRNSNFYRKIKIPFKQTGSIMVPSSVISSNGSGDVATLVTYDSYDNYGNLRQFSEINGITSSAEWSYENGYPVVIAKNVDYTTLHSVISSIQSDLQAFLMNSVGNLTTDAQKSYLKSFNASLRNNISLKNALITTFTYIPSIGMTSQTDPNNITTYYEYDSNNRLKCIKNDNGYIIKTFEYNYNH